ncbi:hypothetical protein LSH36_1346g00005 [Paralvinella palmiformis]|uniref:Sulfotransferase n=1 Tax=Paralvinella palmiformis TaxID=53620 RepID=A0AAD9IUA0_9ANNE|nr:hypothetical protein LSH36_1346g00005 [Paralvinella palmiformis]
MKKKESEEITWIFLLSYQRTGSSFIGSIFNDPDHVFYVYEPIDPLYAAMYGVQDGWTVPNDVFNNRNGTLRSTPEVEKRAVVWTMEQIFTCNMASLPPALLAHSFWYLFNPEMTHAQDYLACIRHQNVKFAGLHRNCQRFIQLRCGVRFGSKPVQQQYCLEILWGNKLDTSSEKYEPNSNKYRYSVSNETLPMDFERYFQCLIKIEPVLTKCAGKYLDEPCKGKKLRAIKTVRANMDASEILLKLHPNIRLVHLYRDPRGVVRSRLQIKWTRGLATRSSVTHEAQLYCSQVLSDIRKRIRLEKQGYSNSIKEIVYDNYVQDRLLNLLDLYNFFGHEPSTKVKRLYENTRIKENYKNIYGNEWIKDMKQEDIKNITSVCSEFYKETSFSWTD